MYSGKDDVFEGKDAHQDGAATASSLQILDGIEARHLVENEPAEEIVVESRE